MINKYEERTTRIMLDIRDELHEINKNLKCHNDLLDTLVYSMVSKNVINDEKEGESNE
jgi:hypothetical protein